MSNTDITPNKMQQKAIDILKGQIMLIAGPGTGKTFTIIERIKNMLNQGIAPEKILCLTFTDAAANEMKRRIENDLNIISCGVQIYTYHGFCCSVIDEFPEEFEIPSNYKVIPDAVSKAFIKECIDELKPKYFRTEKNDPYFYINTIKNRIIAIKQNRMTKEQYIQNLKENPDWESAAKELKAKIDEKIKSGKLNYKTDAGNLESLEKKINQAKELWEFYEKYQEKMNSARYLDFNDMINLVLEKFEMNKGFLNQIANKFEYIMVDEYQDTNRSQNEIVFVLSHALKTENIFVVGDDNQIIYRFQGAKLETIANFLTEFPNTKVICLTENMRSTQEILDAARAVILQDPLNLEKDNRFVRYKISKKLVAKNKDILAKSKPVRFYRYADIMQEYTEIVNEIEELINSDNCPFDKKSGRKKYSEIAVLTRSNLEAENFAELFKQRNIPYELKEGKNIFSITAVNVLFFYIQFLINPQMYSFRIFQLLTAQPFSINPKDYQELFNDVSKEKTFIDVLRRGEWGKYQEPEKLQNFLKTYDYLTEFKSKENIKNTILEIGSKTGIFDYYLNTDINRTESIAGLKCFIDEAVGFSDVYKTSFLEEFYTYIKAILEDEETLNTEKAPVNMNAVQLCTYHGSKGREFEYVYMPTLTAERWESSNKSLKPDIPLDVSEYKTSEELRTEIKPSDLTKLMYVAMTRAKHTLRMSYPEKINGKVKKPTRYLVEIQNMFEKEKEPFEYDEVSYWNQAANLLIKKDYDYKKDFAEFITSLINDRAFSPSAINLYLSCPREYLYEDILKLEPKDGNPNYLSYGIAIHKACEEAVKFLYEMKMPPEKTQFIKWFKDELSNRPMQSYQHREIFEVRGEQALDKYYAQICNTAYSCLVDTEYKLEYEFEDGTKFKGFIDRIDINSDGTYTIYDYKTGNNKNKDIEPGKDHEDYYNQMALYKYFYERKTGNKVSLTKFIYPEDFESKNDGIKFTEDEINVIVNKFKNAIANIKALNFEPTKNRDKSCKYCNYKDYCGMNKL